MKSNIQNKSLFAVICVGMMLAGSSCTGNFDQMNQDPNAATPGMMLQDNLLIGSAIMQMQNYCHPVDANQYQRAYNLVGDVYSGYFGATNNWYSNSNNTTYNIVSEWNDVAFEVGYTRIMAAWLDVYRVREEVPESYALAQILKVYGMHKLTDMYGPIPYNSFGEEGATPYDRQEDVYDTFLDELADAADVLHDFAVSYPESRPLRDYDVVYGGDYSKWASFANTLRLRLAMRIRYADTAKAKEHAEAAVSHAGGLLEQNVNNALYPVAQRNPINEIWDSYADTRMGATIECYLRGFNDPRIADYFTPSTYYTTGTYSDYRGVRNGISITATQRTNYNTRAAKPKVEFTDAMQWMVAAESYFLRAEGALQPGWNMGGTAEDLYNEGIRISFEKSGVSSAAAAYLADDTSTPINYTDPVGSNSYTYPGGNTVTIMWDDADADELKLEKVITQKYLALWPDGQEAWSEFRRTGYPRVIPNRFNNSPGSNISTTEQIRRLIYPTSEYNTNRDEVLKAVEMIGGTDSGGVKLWWDQK